MSEPEQARSARNKALIARTAAAPTKAQILAELDFQIDCAMAAGLRDVARLLHMTKLKVSRLRRRHKISPDGTVTTTVAAGKNHSLRPDLSAHHRWAASDHPSPPV
jgi:hypothetical protein